jgi:tRNA-modifying protein YgfZ
VTIQSPPEIESAYRLLREAAGTVRRARRFAALTGPDVVEFLQGQVTNDVAALEPGDGCYALLLNPKGRILADMRILMRGPEELWIDGEPAPMEAVVSNMTMYKIGRRVEISAPLPGERDLLSVIGPTAREAAGIDPPQREYAFVDGEVDGIEVTAVATDVGIDLIVPAPDVERIAAGNPAAEPVSQSAAEIVRIETGRPRFGLDMGEENLPGELGLEQRAVSFTKGCYVGQEPVARMHHRGHPNRHLRGLELSRDARGGEPVTRRAGESGKTAEAGRTGSACISPTLGPIALALLRREVEPGEQVLVGGDAPAKVVELPFPSPKRDRDGAP